MNVLGATESLEALPVLIDITAKSNVRLENYLE